MLFKKKKRVSGKCISHIYYDRHSLKGHTIRRNLKRFSWLRAKCCLLCCLFFCFVLGFFQTCILHPKIKCTTATMHIKTTKAKPPRECRKYVIFAKDARKMWKQRRGKMLVYVCRNLQQATPALHWSCFI